MNFFDEITSIEIEKNMGICNLTDDFFCLLLNQINRKNNKNILVVVDSVFEANNLYNLLVSYNNNVFLFPMDDFLTSEALAISPDLLIRRLETLNHIINDETPNIIITNLMGYLRFLPTKKDYKDSYIQLDVGSIIDPKNLIDKLMHIGYSRDTIVNKTGEFGVRGFIIDIYPLDEEYPVRVEFFDDEIESIRYFNPDTQKSISNIHNIIIKTFC